MKNIRLTVWIGIMCGWLAAGMLQAGTRPDNARPAEEDGSRLWLPVMRPVEGNQSCCCYVFLPVVLYIENSSQYGYF